MTVKKKTTFTLANLVTIIVGTISTLTSVIYASWYVQDKFSNHDKRISVLEAHQIALEDNQKMMMEKFDSKLDKIYSYMIGGKHENIV